MRRGSRDRSPGVSTGLLDPLTSAGGVSLFYRQFVAGNDFGNSSGFFITAKG
jgi:hypothetical protein